MTVLSLPDAKNHLAIEGDKFDTDLSVMILAAVQDVGNKCGPLEPTAVTDRLDINSGYSFSLRTTPVISLTTATAVYGGSTADVSMLHVSPSGVVTWADGISRFNWGQYDVVYQAGYASTPPALVVAVKEWVRYLWLSRRGAARSNSGATDPADAKVRAEILMEPYVQEFGFA